MSSKLTLGKRNTEERPLSPFHLPPAARPSVPLPSSFGFGFPPPSLAGRISRPPDRVLPLSDLTVFGPSAARVPSEKPPELLHPSKRPKPDPTRLSDKHLLGAWQDVEHWSRLENIAEGHVMDVYVDPSKRYVLKFPKELRKARKPAQDLIEEAVRLGELFTKRKFPLAQILNKETAVKEQRLIMEYFPETLTHIPEHLIPQFEALLKKAKETGSRIDLKPQNFGVKEGQLVLFDWVDDQPSVDCAIRTSIARAGVANPRALYPEGVEWFD